MIAALLPSAAYGDTLPLLRPSAGVTAAEYVALAPLLLANLCAMSFDYLVRQKVQGRHLHWFVVEQLLVIVPEKFAQPLPAKFLTAMRKAQLMNGHHANPTVADFVIPQVLALSYTAHDLAPFARDLGCVDAEGAVLPPFVWDEDKRRVWPLSHAGRRAGTAVADAREGGGTVRPRHGPGEPSAARMARYHRA